MSCDLYHFPHAPPLLLFLLLPLCPLLCVEKEWRKKGQRDEEDEDGELEDELWGLRVLQKQELNKVKQGG